MPSGRRAQPLINQCAISAFSRLFAAFNLNSGSSQKYFQRMKRKEIVNSSPAGSATFHFPKFIAPESGLLVPWQGQTRWSAGSHVRTNNNVHPLQMWDIRQLPCSRLREPDVREHALYHPLVCSICASSRPAAASPFIAPTKSSLTSSKTFGS